MPGNGVGDRVHNFFAQDTFSQGQRQSEVLDKNQPGLNNNLWAGNQGPNRVPSYATKGFNLQQSVDTGRGSNIHLANGPHGLNFTRFTSRPEIQLQSQQQSFNGYTYGNLYETQQDEGNFLEADSDKRNVASAGSFYEQSLQGVSLQHQAQMVNSGASLSSGNFGLFGGHQQMNRQQSNMLQPLQLQQSGLKDMHQLQQQVMFMRMQEFQMQQKLQQPDGRQQNPLNQTFPFHKVAPSNHSYPLVHSDKHSRTLGFPGEADNSNTTWLQSSSSALQVSSNGLLSTNHGQGHHMMGLTPQQIDQSLFGVPVSTLRTGGIHSSQYSQAVTDKLQMQQSASFSSSIPFQHNAQSPDQIGVQDATTVSRQRFIGEKLFGNGSSQSLYNEINMENLQEVNAIQHSEAIQEFQEREEAASPSVNPQEKALNKIHSPPSEVGLDPTEERILFGSDDNIWAAFGKSVNTGEEASNSLDAPGLLNGFSSIQAGTWSALMQSAVAEASSTDLGPQEELSGLNFQSTVIPSQNQKVSMNNNGRQQSNLMDAHIPFASSLNREAGQPSDSDNLKNNCINHPRFQQFGHKYVNDISQKMQSNSMHRLVQPSEEGSKWPAVAPIQISGAEGSPMQTSTSHVFDREVDSKMVSSSWIDELDRPSKTHDKINDSDALGSTVPTEDASARIHSSQNCSNSLGSSQNIGIHGGTVHTGAFWKVDHETCAAANFELKRYSPASGPVNPELLCLKGAETFVKHSSLSGTEETSRFLSNKNPNQVKHWKNANTLEKGKETLGFERSHSHNINDNHILNSLETTSQGDRMHEADIYDKTENSNDSYRSNVSHQNSAGSLRENVLIDSSDSRSLFTSKEKLSKNTGKKNSARKFHYHPMGNLDENVGSPNGLQKALSTQAMTSQTAHVAQSKLFIQGQLDNVLRDGQWLADVHTQSCFPSSVPNISVPLTRSVDILPQFTASPSSSPSMLQLLPKVDQSRVFGSTMPKAENSDGSVVRRYPSHSSASQVFGLQLGPPSQFLPVQNHLLSSQSSMRTVCSSSPSQSVVEIGDKAHIASMSQVKSFHSSETGQGEFAIKSEVLTNGNNEYSQNKMPGEFHPAFSSGLPYSRSRIKNQLMDLKSQSPSRSFKDTTYFTEEDDSHREPSCGLSVKNLSHEVASNIACPTLPNLLGTCKQASTIDSHETPERSFDNSLHASQLLSSSIMSQQTSLATTMGNTWNTSHENPCLHQPNVVGTSSATENRGDQDATTGENSSTEVYTNCLNPLGKIHREEELMKESHQHVSLSTDIVEKINKAQEEHIINNPSDVYPVFSASMQRDIEAFGRSLKPNNLSHQNYSSPNQIQSMKNEEIEHSKALKRSRHSDDSSVCLQVKHVVVPPVDSRMPKFSEPAHMEINMTSQEVIAPTQEMHGIHMDDSRTISIGNNANSVKFKHTHVSPQMAPTWFNHFGSGTFKNGQVLHDAQNVSATNMGEPPLVLDKSFSSLHMFKTKQQLVPSNNDTGQDVKPSLHPIPAAAEQFCSSTSLSVGMGDQHSLLRPKKRKHILSHSSPWCDVISQGSRNLQTISFSEMVWAKAVNHVAEKVEEDVDLNENTPPRQRARRRLVLSSQLLQQVFQPPPKRILSANSYAEYEDVAYSVSRLALGDACGVVSRFNKGADGIERISSKCKELEDNDHHLSKVIEEFTERTRILEEEFLKLDRRLSLVDLVTENQDLEKFSVINRFAKFYGRGQADGAGTPSTSSESATHLCNPFAQRYVTPLPMPRDLPTDVQCFSL